MATRYNVTPKERFISHTVGMMAGERFHLTMAVDGALLHGLSRLVDENRSKLIDYVSRTASEVCEARGIQPVRYDSPRDDHGDRTVEVTWNVGEIPAPDWY